MLSKIVSIEAIWLKSETLRRAFQEYVVCLENIDEEYANLFGGQDAGNGFEVSYLPFGNEVKQFRRNLFSTLFQSIYHLLDIEPPRRVLYGQINHLFRTWVTSADNLLDNEDKLVLPITLPNESHVMHNVIALMAADRVLARLLGGAVGRGDIDTAGALRLSDKTLEVLLASAAEEASEEGGIDSRPEPEYVLNVIHRLKTGLLFCVPFAGIDTLEKNIDREKLAMCKRSLEQFGLGCQLLDDIRDIGKDLLQKRHNYVLSCIYNDNRQGDIEKLEDIAGRIDIDSKVHCEVGQVAGETAALAMELLTGGLEGLEQCGLDIDEESRKGIASSMFHVLDVGDMTL